MVSNPYKYHSFEHRFSSSGTPLFILWNTAFHPLEHRFSSSGTPLFILWNTAFHTLEHRFSYSGTPLFILWNTAFHTLEHRFSYSGTPLFKEKMNAYFDQFDFVEYNELNKLIGKINQKICTLLINYTKSYINLIADF